MAIDPAFAAVARVGSVLTNATADTSLTAPTNTATVYTAAATRQVTDAVTTVSSPVVTSATASFVSAVVSPTASDEGRAVSGTNIQPGTTIAAVVNSTTVILSQAALASGTALNFAVLGRGAKVEEIRCVQVVSTTVAGILNLFLYDGATYHVFDEFVYAILAFTATVQVTPVVPIYYNNLVIPAGWSLRVTNTAGTVASHKVSAFAGDL